MRFSPKVDFWDRVEKTDGCWLWKAGKDSDGYGGIWRGGKMQKSHRLAWELINGPIPAGLNVLHHCDNRSCCRPDHLFIGTQAQNMADMAAKGRSARGDLNGARTHPEAIPRGEARAHSKLTATQVLEIRSRHAAGERLDSLAMRFGVSVATIRDITTARKWKHVPFMAKISSPIVATECWPYTRRSGSQPPTGSIPSTATLPATPGS